MQDELSVFRLCRHCHLQDVRAAVREIPIPLIINRLLWKNLLKAQWKRLTKVPLNNLLKVLWKDQLKVPLKVLNH